MERRFAENQPGRTPGLIDELVRLNVDVIVTIANDAAVAAQKATNTIPIVFWAVNDPIGQGLVRSLARPGGNVTGLTNVNTELARKRLALLHEAVPETGKIGVLDPGTRLILDEWKEFESGAQRLGVVLHEVNARNPEQFESAFVEFTGARAGAVFVPPSQLAYSHRERLVALAIRHRLPMMGWVREWAEAGAIVSYGPSNFDGQRRTAGYVARILNGAKPGDLPIEQPTKFELVLNLKTAKALSVTIPPSLLLRADHVIE
jgi:putative ABC transport system substrate-binding protein